MQRAEKLPLHDHQRLRAPWLVVQSEVQGSTPVTVPMPLRPQLDRRWGWGTPVNPLP